MEHHHTEHHIDNHPDEINMSKLGHKLKHNPWIVCSIILGIVVLVLLFFVLRGGTSGKVSGKIAAENLINFAKAQGATATLVNVSDLGNFYEVVLSIGGQEAPIYVTKDGKYFTQAMIPLTEDTSKTNTQPTDTSQPVEIPIDNSPVLGKSDAILTIVEFSDFSCPFCGAASGQSKDMVEYMISKYPTWQPMIPGIIKDYVETGKAKFVFKYSMGHTGGKPAMLVGLCLNDQGLFFKFHDKAFANQSNVEDLSKMKDLAKSLGADVNKLQICLDSKKYDSKLVDDQSLGQKIGIGGTPALYANGVKVASGAEDYTDVKKAIEAVLAQVK